MRTRRCNGKMRNGPGKQLARCEKCGQVDFEANEGDRCTCEVAVDGEEQERPRTIRPPKRKHG